MNEDKQREEQKNRFFQKDNTIATKDRVVAWPRMGNIDLSMVALVSSLGVKIVEAPPNTNEALEIGVAVLYGEGINKEGNTVIIIGELFQQSLTCNVSIYRITFLLFIFIAIDEKY